MYIIQRKKLCVGSFSRKGSFLPYKVLCAYSAAAIIITVAIRLLSYCSWSGQPEHWSIQKSRELEPPPGVYGIQQFATHFLNVVILRKFE